MSLTERLSACTQFRGLEPDELDALAHAMEEVDAPDGHVFIREGEHADGCFLVLEGSVEISHRDSDVPLQDLGPGDLFGLVALLDHGPRSATCRAKGPVKAARLAESAFNLLHEGAPSLVLHFQRLVASQLARDARRLNEALVAAMLDRESTDDTLGLSGDFHLSVDR